MTQSEELRKLALSLSERYGNLGMDMAELGRLARPAGRPDIPIIRDEPDEDIIPEPVIRERDHLKRDADIVCYTDRYVIRRTGETITQNQYGTQINGEALAQAIRYHGHPGMTFRVDGPQSGFPIGGGNPHSPKTVFWENNRPVTDITILGGTRGRTMSIRGFSTFYSLGGAGNLRFQNLTLINTAGNKCPVLIGQNNKVGKISLYDINFAAEDESTWAGNGMLWNVRGHGLAQWDMRNINFHRAKEHGAYIENPQGDSNFINMKAENLGRTLLQVVNREISGETAFGDVTVRNCIAKHCGIGDGGSDFSFYGIGTGTINFLDNKSIGHPDGSSGAFTHTVDHGHGAYLNHGYATRRLLIKGFDVDHPNADRTHVTISGVGRFRMVDFLIKGNKTALELMHEYGGGVDNGTVQLVTPNYPTSQWPGWQGREDRMVTKYDHDADHLNILTDAQIDALGVIP